MATIRIGGIMSGAKGDIPRKSGIRIRPTTIHQANPYAAPQPKRGRVRVLGLSHQRVHQLAEAANDQRSSR